MELGNLWQIQQIMLKATQPDQAGPTLGPTAVEFQAWRAGTVYTALVLKTLWLEGEWGGGSRGSLGGCVRGRRCRKDIIEGGKSLVNNQRIARR